MIELKHLGKIYSSASGSVEALKDVNLTIADGEIFGIIGLSGAGKSTLVRCINLLERPTSGEVWVDGQNLTALSEKALLQVRRQIGMIFQSFNLLEQRSVLRNVCFPLEISGTPKAEAKKRAEELLKVVGLADKAASFPSQLSGGQKQRVAIARALATNPRYLLCDEATSALDPNTTRSILELLREINKTLGVTIIVITHEMKVIDQICDRVAVIDHHRRAASYIENAAFSFHEPYASSASELVTELLQYLVEPADLLREEAEALLAGIVLDTKHFTLRTGGRTFEAAAFLRRAGADTTDVQRLFQSDLSEMVSRYDIIRRAELYREDIAVAAIDQEGVDRVTAAQAADELLSLKGVKASFVVFPSGENVQMSARSLGEVNVQVILEALGGGGNSTTAGGRVENTDVETVKSRLLEAIDAYFEK